MQLTFALSTQEADAILIEYFADRYNMKPSEIKVVIGEVDHVQNIQDATIKMRSDLIKRIETLMPKEKFSAIKEFRAFSHAGLKESKFFVESPDKWEHYIKTGEYQ